MVEVKVMPYSEKYALALDTIKSIEMFVPPFIQKHLGDAEAAELQSIWKEGVKPISEGASDEEKYEVTYGNFIWMAKNDLSFVRGHMGEKGIEQFKRAEVEALKKENASPALFLLKLIRTISPGTAFTMTSKQMSYKLQWLTPFSLSELTRNKAVIEIPHCKILDFPDVDDICVIDCQNVYALWLAEQFKVEMKSERQGNSCTLTITPLR